ncbi:type II secretion system protein F [Salinibacterium sp. dk2585]|uniref:type II secretion system F family protein n=1 Tax=unclassified Salinibacterium TaxID=2632331 RepID=UPI0011C24594|nr:MULTISPECIES: type II secretion system F family protein [unclassified Salinibacterium]QEE60512.1 type II secretion system protein F [Salinibacterium sp. dk2585]TXK55584.1 type II secretion system protein F [Salinibacterium sp. dk5596]
MELVLGALLLGIGLLVLVIGVILPPRIHRSPATDDPDAAAEPGAIAALERAVAAMLPRGYRGSLSADIELAGGGVTPGRVVLRTLAVSIAAGVILGGLTVPLLGVLAVLVLPLGTPFALRLKADSIRRRFEDQLTDTLQLLASSLRAGNSLLKALDTVAEEAAQPTAREFVRAVNEVRVGSDLGHALDNIAQRMHSTDFEWVSQAVDIHREVGGNLAEVLDQVSETLRDRNQMRRQIQSLSADGRLSAWVLMALPLVVPLLLSLINPGFLAPMISSPIGWALLGISAVLLLIGGIWIRRLVAMPL